MTRRQIHYEAAFEHFLRSRRIPYIAVDEARKTLLPLQTNRNRQDSAASRACGPSDGTSLKSFDFVVHPQGQNLIVDVKGRLYGSARADRPDGRGGQRVGGRRFETWVTAEDVEAMMQWQSMLGIGFRSVFVFIYGLRAQPPDALFETVFEFSGWWYAVRRIDVEAYRAAMRTRSRRWGTVDLPASAARRLSQPFRL